MKKIYIVANWKSNKTEYETKEWLEQISKIKAQISIVNDKEIIVCPSFVHLSLMKSFIEAQGLPIKLGAQNISPFDEGAYTGEVNAKQIKELAEYVLVGHSERKKYFSETEAMLKEKVKSANKWNLKTIFCADNEQGLAPEGVSVIVYEPPTSISPAPADTPENAEKAAKALRTKTLSQTVLYGGNVTSENVSSFMQMESISGVLVGRASLNAREFYEIIQNA